MELWFTERQTPHAGITCEVRSTLRVEKTEFQELAVYDTVQFGRMLVLDGCVMTTIADEFLYHEMIAHIPMCTHPNPQRVLVVGGGDGGTVREVLKHPSVQEVELCEIDGRVIDVSREFFPELADSLSDPRVKILVKDGIAHIHEHQNYYDVILVDSPDPIGPAVGLFAHQFYQGIFNALKVDGLFAAQTESPIFNRDLISRVYRDISSIFPITKLYLGPVVTYPSGSWSWTLGSKQIDPAKVDVASFPPMKTRLFNPEIYRSCFALPNYVQELLNATGDGSLSQK